MSASAIQFSPRLSSKEMEQLRDHMRALANILAPAAGGNDLYGLCARDALSAVMVVEHNISEMRREGTRS